MLKVLLCERSFTGHRKKYLEVLSTIDSVEVFCYIPDCTNRNDKHYYELKDGGDVKSLSRYYHWIREIRSIIEKNHIDVVHFLDGDSIMRYFGLGFSYLNCRIVITYHHFFSSAVRVLSYKMMLFSKKNLAVVHTHYIEEQLDKIRINNTKAITYPSFDIKQLSTINNNIAREYWRIDNSYPTIGIIGGIASYKNVIPFLNCLGNIEDSFNLLICGKNVDIDQNELDVSLGKIKNVRACIRTLNNDEYNLAISASDIIFSIYAKEFDGASGIVTDGIIMNKMILSCNHGSLGDIVSRNHLGIVANCEDINDIMQKTTIAINSVKDFEYDDIAQNYKKELSPERFKEKYSRVYLIGE